jgi:hypothetical protein
MKVYDEIVIQRFVLSAKSAFNLRYLWIALGIRPQISQMTQIHRPTAPRSVPQP